MNPIKTVVAAVAIMLVTALTAVAQQPPAPYGAPMSLDAAKKAVQGDDHAAITTAAADLQKASHQMAEQLYKATQSTGGGEPGAPGADAGATPPDGDVVDAEFSETK